MNRINKLLAIVAATACMTSCNMLAEDYKEFISNQSDEVQKIKLSGPIEVRNIEVGEFNAIESEFGIMDIEYSQSEGEPMVQLCCNNEIMALADIYVDNEVLYIEMNDSVDFEDIQWEIDKDYECVLKCSSKQLKSITQKGSGNLIFKTAVKGDTLKIDRSGMGDLECLQPLDVKEMNISTSGSGNTCMCGTFDRMEIETSGLGNFNINGPFSAKYLAIDKRGSGTMELIAKIEIIDSIKREGVVGYVYTHKDVYSSVNIDTLKIETSGLGDIKIESNEIVDATIDMSGSGNLETCLLEVGSITIRKSGLGDIEIWRLEAKNVMIESGGSGNIEINKLKTDGIHLSCSGMGDVEINKGVATTARIDYSGSGSLKAKGLSADNMQFVASGIGNHRIGEVKTLLDVKLRDKTSLTYSGNPASVKENIGKNAKLKKR